MRSCVQQRHGHGSRGIAMDLVGARRVRGCVRAVAIDLASASVRRCAAAPAWIRRRRRRCRALRRRLDLCLLPWPGKLLVLAAAAAALFSLAAISDFSLSVSLSVSMRSARDWR